VSAIETAEIRAVMDANDAANVGFMADASLGQMMQLWQPWQSSTLKPLCCFQQRKMNVC